MPTRVGTKEVGGRRVACTSSSGPFPGGKLDRLYPECRSKAAFTKVLRQELSLEESATLKDVARNLRTKTWNGQRWLTDVNS